MDLSNCFNAIASTEIGELFATHPLWKKYQVYGDLMLNYGPTTCHFPQGNVQMFEGVPQGGVLSMPMACDIIKTHFDHLAHDDDGRYTAYADDSLMPFNLARLKRIIAKAELANATNIAQNKVKGVIISLSKSEVLLDEKAKDFNECKALCLKHNITVKTDAIKVTGIPVGTDTGITNLLSEKFEEFQRDLAQYKHLDNQQALYLFRYQLLRPDFLIRNVRYDLINPFLTQFQDKALQIIDFITGVNNTDDIDLKNPEYYINSIPQAQLPLGFSGLGLHNVVARAAASRLVGISTNVSLAIKCPPLQSIVWSNLFTEALSLREILLKQAPVFANTDVKEDPNLPGYDLLPTETDLKNTLIEKKGILKQVTDHDWMKNLMVHIYNRLYRQLFMNSEPERKIVLEQGQDKRSIGRRFLTTIPSNPATSLNPDEFKHAIRNVLGKHAYGNNEICSLCNQESGKKIGHFLACRKIPAIKRHDMFVSKIGHALKLIHPVYMETLTAPGNGKRRMDIRMDINGTIHWCDVSFTSEFQQQSIDHVMKMTASDTLNGTFPYKQVLENRHRVKMRKYKDDADRKWQEYKCKVKIEPLIFTCGGAIHNKSWAFLIKMAKEAKKLHMPYWLKKLLDALSFGLHRTSYAMERKGIFDQGLKRLQAVPGPNY